MLLAVPQSLLVLLPKINMRGPKFAGKRYNCFIHIVTTKLLTFPKPRAELVTAAKLPLTPVVPWLGFEERFNARLGLVKPATPELAALWGWWFPPFCFIFARANSPPPPRVPRGVVVPNPAS